MFLYYLFTKKNVSLQIKAHTKMSKGEVFCKANEKFTDGITNGAAWYTGKVAKV